MTINSEKNLIAEAIKARDKSYSPYSGFAVGAALLCENGSLYQGCNIENAAYTPCNCAERTAFFKAVSEGQRSFKAIAIVGAKAGEKTSDYCSPCGVCRQVMKEFCKDDFKIIMAKDEDDYIVKDLSEIFPMGFGPDNLK